MGLFDKLGASLAGRVGGRAPEAVPASEDPGAVCAPVSGRVVALSELSDLAFARGMLGAGAGIRPAEGVDVAFSPVSGTVEADVRTRHALLVRSEGGAEVLLHVGLDSVALRGEGFRQLVRKGDAVRAGQPVLGFDRALMAARGLDDTVIVTVTNSDAFARVETFDAGAEVRAGATLLRCLP